MSPSWNFPARAEPSYEGSEPSRAKLGHFNFRAESELKIPTKYHNFFQPFFPPSFHYQILLVYHVPKKFCDHLLANKVFLELVALYELYILDAYLFYIIMKINKKIGLQLRIEFWLIFGRFSARFWSILHPS